MWWNRPTRCLRAIRSSVSVPEDVRPQEGARVVDRAVDVRLGGEVDDDVAARHRLVHGRLVADVGLDDRDLLGDRRQARAVPGVGEGVDHHDLVVRVRLDRVVDEVGADEPGAACDQELHGPCLLRSIVRGRAERGRRAGSPAAATGSSSAAGPAQYPAGLEEEMTAHFRRILHQRRGPRELPDMEEPVRAAGSALPLEANRIPATSALPGGELLHKTVARSWAARPRAPSNRSKHSPGRSRPPWRRCWPRRELDRTIQVDVAHSLDALYERQAAQERILTAAGFADRRGGAAGTRGIVGIHQIVVSASPGDAVTNTALGFQEVLQRVAPSECSPATSIRASRGRSSRSTVYEAWRPSRRPADLPRLDRRAGGRPVPPQPARAPGARVPQHHAGRSTSPTSTRASPASWPRAVRAGAAARPRPIWPWPTRLQCPRTRRPRLLAM